MKMVEAMMMEALDGDELAYLNSVIIANRCGHEQEVRYTASLVKARSSRPIRDGPGCIRVRPIIPRDFGQLSWQIPKRKTAEIYAWYQTSRSSCTVVFWELESRLNRNPYLDYLESGVGGSYPTFVPLVWRKIEGRWISSLSSVLILLEMDFINLRLAWSRMQSSDMEIQPVGLTFIDFYFDRQPLPEPTLVSDAEEHGEQPDDETAAFLRNERLGN